MKNIPTRPEPVEDLLSDDEPQRCEFVSEDGVRCRNQARPGSRFCGLHEPDAIESAEDLI